MKLHRHIGNPVTDLVYKKGCTTAEKNGFLRTLLGKIFKQDRIMYIFIILVIIAVLVGGKIFNTFASRDWNRSLSDDNPPIKKENYHFGFYYNPKDDRNFVPKRYGKGFTLNLGKPVVVLVTILLVGLLLSLTI